MDNPNLKNSCGWVCEQVCESECMCVDIYIELDGHASFCEQAIHFFPHWLYHRFCDETQLSCFFKYLSYGDMVEYHIKVKRVGGGGNDTGIVGLASSHLGDPRGKRRLLPSSIRLNPREQLWQSQPSPTATSWPITVVGIRKLWLARPRWLAYLRGQEEQGSVWLTHLVWSRSSGYSYQKRGKRWIKWTKPRDVTYICDSYFRKH